jgi:hypothetical protein
MGVKQVLKEAWESTGGELLKFFRGKARVRTFWGYLRVMGQEHVGGLWVVDVEGMRVEG